MCPAMAYFVTGATGFIGRHLVQELLDNREGEIFVLVREGSRAAPRDADPRAGAPTGSSRSSATSAEPGLGVDADVGRRAPRRRSTTSSTSPRSTT